MAAGCGTASGPRAADTAPPVDAKVARAEIAEVRQTFEAGGTVRARNTATIVSRIVADVREIRVAPGDRVQAGQTLVVLDSREFQANRARAEAAAVAAEQTERAATAGEQAASAGLTLASATYTRIAELRQKNSATPNELDQATAGLRAAEAQTETARARVAEARAAFEAARAAAEAARVEASYATLTAPFGGVVTEKLVEVGNLATPGLPLLRLEDTRGFRLEVRLDASRAALITVGERAEVDVDGTSDAAPTPPTGGATRPGTVAEIARALDPGSQAFLVKVELPDRPGLRSGLFGRARFAEPSRRALAVPAGSLVRRGQLTSVFVVDTDGRARLRLVSVAAGSGDRVEIQAGLDDGETVVVDPPAGLVDGAAVRPVPAATAPAPERSGALGSPRATAPGGVQGPPPEDL